MNVHIEPLAGVLRVFDETSNYGDPYELALTVRYVDQTTIEILGLDKPITPTHWRAIRQHLKTLGIAKVMINRHGKMKAIEL